MALEDYDDCLCSWVGTVGAPVAKQLKAFVESVKAIVEVTIAFEALLRNDYEDRLAAKGLELSLELAKTLVEPVQQPLKYLDNLTRPYADCSPVGTFSKAIRDLDSFVLERVEEAEFEIQNFILALEKNSQQQSRLTAILEVLEGIIEALEYC